MTSQKGMNEHRERRFGPWKRVELLSLTAKYRNWEPKQLSGADKVVLGHNTRTE